MEKKKKLTRKEKKFLKNEWKTIGLMTKEATGKLSSREKRRLESEKATGKKSLDEFESANPSSVVHKSTPVENEKLSHPQNSTVPTVPVPNTLGHKPQECSTKKLTKQEKEEIKEAQKQFNQLITIKRKKGGFIMNFNPFKKKDPQEEGQTETTESQTETTEEKTAGAGINLIPKVRQYFKENFACDFFNPKSTTPTVTIARYPKIFFTRQAYDDIRIITGLGKDEVGWLATVRRLEENPEHFIIDEVVLIKQETSPTTCKLDDNAIGRYFSELGKTEEGEEKLATLLFWGHLHPNFSVSPSGQDETQFNELSRNVDYYIRGIFNKRGDMNLTLRVNPFGVTFKDVAWDIIDPVFTSRVEEIAEEMNEKLEPEVRFPYTPITKMKSPADQRYCVEGQ